MPWRPSTRAPWVDAVPAAVVTATGAVEVALGRPAGPPWVTVPSVVLFGAALLVRRRHPWPALLVVFGAILGLHLAGVDQDGYLASIAAALLVMSTFAGEVDLAQAVAGLVLAAAVLIVSTLSGLTSIIWGVGLLAGAWAAGRALRTRRLLIERLDRTTTELRLSREAHARDAVLAERTRIARELHDVIAHSVGVMVVQAGAAERMVALDPDRAVAAAQSVQECGHEALVDLRRLLGVLRPDDDDGAGLTPQPGVGDVPALVGRLREAGLSVRVDRAGEARALPAGVDLAAYRIVQEALTNVLKHAAVPAAALTLRYDDGGLGIEVVNAPGPRTGGVGTRGDGHGLVGMRERTLMYGGSFAAGPDPDGRFVVRVHLPAAPA